MKKYGWIVLLVIALVVSAIVYFYTSSSNKTPNYSAERSGLNNISNSNNTTSNSLNNTSIELQRTPIETEIASFSTKIQNKKDKNRQGNITITCSSLNSTIVKPR